MIELQKIKPISLNIKSTNFKRADLEFYQINHKKPSQIVLIFFNDTKLTKRNVSYDRESYAGKFSIFGHANCSGDEGHCDVTINLNRRRFDDRPSHPLTPAFARTTVTEALKNVIERNDTELAITLVAISSDDDLKRGEKLLEYGGIKLVTFE